MQIELTEEQLARLQVRDSARRPRGTGECIHDPRLAYEHFRHIGDLSREHVMMLTLDSRRRAIAKHEVSVGVLDASLVHPREVFRRALLDNAARIILAHNHPSGDLSPSEDDLLITKRLVTAGKIIGVPLLDHMIISWSGFWSMQEHSQVGF